MKNKYSIDDIDSCHQDMCCILHFKNPVPDPLFCEVLNQSFTNQDFLVLTINQNIPGWKDGYLVDFLKKKSKTIDDYKKLSNQHLIQKFLRSDIDYVDFDYKDKFIETYEILKQHREILENNQK